MSTSPSDERHDSSVSPGPEKKDTPSATAQTVTLSAGDSVPGGAQVAEDLRGTVPPGLMSACSSAEGSLTGYQRYQDFTNIGAGGMGVVQSCLDPSLGRRVALKFLRPQFEHRTDSRIRFIREARVMAQLEHPNIVPVHELCVRPDGTVYFTMKKVGGVSLKTVMERLGQKDPAYEATFDLEKLLDIFGHVCEAMAFAHTHGAMHRDLKPENILIGDFGEVLVLDWGLVKLIDGEDDPLAARCPLVLEMDTQETADLTIQGSVSGTPAYMSPEQAQGLSDLDTRTDIYSLGAILYEMLSLQKTVSGQTVPDILRDVVGKACDPPRLRAPERSIPRELDAICMKALDKDRERRYQSVADLMKDVQDYRRGVELSCCHYPPVVRLWKSLRRRPVRSAASAAILGTLAFAVSATLLGEYLRRSQLLAAGNIRYEAGCLLYEQQVQMMYELVALRKQQVLQQKSPRELELETRIADLEQETESNLREAVLLFVQVPIRGRLKGLALSRIVGIFRRRIEYELLKGDYARAGGLVKVFEGRFGASFEELPVIDRDALKRAVLAIKGDGVLALETEPSGADVTLNVLLPDARGLLHPAYALPLGATPIEGLKIPRGSYLMEMRLPDRPKVDYPVHVGHGANERLRVILPPSIPEGTVYVPGGDALIGGVQSRYERLHREFIPGFFMKTLEVTFGEYLEFWREEAGALPDPELMSRVRFRLAERRFFDAWNDAGELLGPLDPSFPVVGLTQYAMERYCAWLSQRTGVWHRLPTADEWEKAARGVDGRDFAWGDTFDPTFAQTVEDVAVRSQDELWLPVGSHPLDVSVYGVFDMMGSVREMTSSLFPGDSPFLQIKGASLATPKRFAYCAYASESAVVPSDVGFRFVIPLDQGNAPGT